MIVAGLVKKFVITPLVIIAVAAGGLFALNKVPGMSFLNFTSESRDSQVINSITREEQVVLLSLGIQGISEEKQKAKFFGMGVPGSSRATFMQYAFSAKLGIEGKDVRIEQTGDNTFRVDIPKFIFIGHKDENFRLVAEDNGVLSFTAPEIDTVEMINTILSTEAKDEYVEKNEELLREQAESFYRGIISGVDSTVEVEFSFNV